VHAVPPAFLGRSINVDAVEQRVELSLAHLDARRIGVRRLREPEGTFVQPLLKLAQPTAVEEQNFERALSFAEEDE
jgi:hypothetical protein